MAIRRIVGLYPGDARTDEKNAFAVADAVRSQPHTLRDLTKMDVDEVSPGVLTECVQDLSRQVN